MQHTRFAASVAAIVLASSLAAPGAVAQDSQGAEGLISSETEMLEMSSRYEEIAAVAESLEAEQTADLFGPDALGSSAWWNEAGQDALFRRVTQLRGSSDALFFSAVGLRGSSEYFVGNGSVPEGYPLPVDESIKELKLVSRTPEKDGIERWVIASPSMKRNVEVQVRLAADPNKPAPVLTLLDGISTQKHSGWIQHGSVKNVFGEEQVILAMPSDGWGSMYLDWDKTDPNIGHAKWETFIVTELVPLMDKELNTNGKHGIGGLSMGAAGAMMISNANPGVFDATFGLSGCYSLSDPIGEATSLATIFSGGGNPANLWTEPGSPTAQRYDVQANPAGLKNSRVYLATGDGAWSLRDAQGFAGTIPGTVSSGSLLERGAYNCALNLGDSLQESGHQNYKVDVYDHGLHNGDHFNEEAGPAWEYIKPALY